MKQEKIFLQVHKGNNSLCYSHVTLDIGVYSPMCCHGPSCLKVLTLQCYFYCFACTDKLIGFKVKRWKTIFWMPSNHWCTNKQTDQPRNQVLQSKVQGIHLDFRNIRGQIKDASHSSAVKIERPDWNLQSKTKKSRWSFRTKSNLYQGSKCGECGGGKGYGHNARHTGTLIKHGGDHGSSRLGLAWLLLERAY